MNFSSVKTKPKILMGVAVPLVLLIILGIIAITSISKITTTSGWVNHTYNVLGKANDIVASAVDMETGMRGYLLAGKEEFLDPYKGGSVRFFELIEALQQTVSDNPGQVARLGEVESVIREWQTDVTQPMITLRREIGDAETMNDMAALVGEARGKTFFDKFRGQIATFIERERVLLQKREADFAKLLTAPTVDTGDVKETMGWVTHTYAVIGSANDIIAAAVDMETGMRGYLLAGKETFLDPYKGGSAKFFTLTKALRETVSDNPAQVQLLSEVDETIHAWQQNVTEPMIALRRKIGDAKTMDDMAELVGQAKGKLYFDKFRGLMADFSAEEESLMVVRKAQNEETEQTTNVLLVAGTLIAIVLGGGLGWMTGNGIANPISRMTDAMARLADGDTDTEVPDRDRRDEVGGMAAAVQVFKDNMIKADNLAAQQAEEQEARENRSQKIEQLTRDFDTNVSQLLGAVTSSTADMENTATSMQSIANDTNTRATTVATAAEQASANVQTVATATEELASSIQEISRQVSQSSQIAGRAVEEANKADRQVNGLVEVANKVGEVISLISDIAEQTNLLALNATIEAARAGDAGKGFAVVANEVKSLASQTAKATDEIGQQIQDIQSETANAASAIQGIGKTISEMNEIATAIATAVEQQGAATGEIARNVEQASSGTQEVSTNIIEVTRAAGETGGAADQVTGAAGKLNENADSLKVQVEEFLQGVRAA